MLKHAAFVVVDGESFWCETDGEQRGHWVGELTRATLYNKNDAENMLWHLKQYAKSNKFIFTCQIYEVTVSPMAYKDFQNEV